MESIDAAIKMRNSLNVAIEEAMNKEFSVRIQLHDSTVALVVRTILWGTGLENEDAQEFGRLFSNGDHNESKQFYYYIAWAVHDELMQCARNEMKLNLYSAMETMKMCISAKAPSSIRIFYQGISEQRKHELVHEWFNAFVDKRNELTKELGLPTTEEVAEERRKLFFREMGFSDEV